MTLTIISCACAVVCYWAPNVKSCRARFIGGLAASVLFVALIFLITELPSLGDSTFYAAQAASTIDNGSPTYPPAMLRSALVSSGIVNGVIVWWPQIAKFFGLATSVLTFLLIGLSVGPMKNFARLLSISVSVWAMTGLSYYLKMDYMDFYPTAVFLSIPSVVYSARFFSQPTIKRAFITGVLSAVAISGHSYFVTIAVCLGISCLAISNIGWLDKVKFSSVMICSSAFGTILSLSLTAQLRWPLIDGNLRGGGDGKYLSDTLLSGDQIYNALLIVVAVLIPVVSLILMHRIERASKVFVLSQAGVYLIFLLLYGFDLGLVADRDLQLMPIGPIAASLVVFLSRSTFRRSSILVIGMGSLFSSSIALSF